MILDPQNALFKDNWLIHDDVAENLVTALPDPGIGSRTAIGSAPGRAAYWWSAFARGLTPKNHKE